MGIFSKCEDCFGHWFRPKNPNSSSRKDRRRQMHIRVLPFKCLKRFRSSHSERVHPVLGNYADALSKEGLLVPGSSDHPALNICVDFLDDELQHYRRAERHKSYKRSRWDDVLASSRVREVAMELYVNEPIVDELPVSLWLDCVDPILPALISLSQMQRRKTNLTKSKPSATPFPDPNASIRDHGDFDLQPWFVGVAPPQGNNVLLFLLPTEEVRPTLIIENGHIEHIVEKIRWYDLVTAHRGRQNVRSKCTRISSPQVIYTSIRQISLEDEETDQEAEDHYHLIRDLFDE